MRVAVDARPDRLDQRRRGAEGAADHDHPGVERRTDPGQHPSDGLAASPDVSDVPALAFRPVDSLQRHLYQQRDNGQRSDGDESDRRGLAGGAVEALCHEQTHAETKGGPGQGQQSVQGQRLRRFWNG